MYQNMYTNTQLYSSDYLYEGVQPYCIHQSHNMQYPPGLANQYDFQQNQYIPGYNDAFISQNFDRIEIKYSLYIRYLSTIKLLYYIVTQHNGQLSYMRIYDGYNVDIVFYSKKDSDFIYKQLNNTTLNNELLKFYFDDSFSRNVPTLPAFSGLSKNKPPNGIHLLNNLTNNNGNMSMNQNPSNSMNGLPINATIPHPNSSNISNNQSISLNNPSINLANSPIGHNNLNSSHNLNNNGLNSPINTNSPDERNNIYYQHINSSQSISPNDELPFSTNNQTNQSNQIPIDIPLPPTTNTHLQSSIVSLCSSMSSMTITPHLNFGMQPITKSTSLNSPIVITNGVNDNLYMKFNYTNNGYKNNIKGSKMGGNGMRNKSIIDNNNSTSNSVNNKKLSDAQNTSINLSISASGRIRSPHTDADNSVYQIDVNKIKNKQDLRTTLMIKNIPNKYTQNMVLYEINLNHHKKYDFFYLPIDFKNKCNVGYAFINFINPYDVLLFFNEFNNRKWNKFNSDKICEVRYGRIQGKSSLINHFKNSSVMVVDEQFRPLLFYSNGANKGEPEEFPE